MLPPVGYIGEQDMEIILFIKPVDGSTVARQFFNRVQEQAGHTQSVWLLHYEFYIFKRLRPYNFQLYMRLMKLKDTDKHTFCLE